MSQPLGDLFRAPQPTPLQKAIGEAATTLSVLGPLTGAVYHSTPALQLRILDEIQNALVKAAGQIAEARCVVEAGIERELAGPSR